MLKRHKIVIRMVLLSNHQVRKLKDKDYYNLLKYITTGMIVIFFIFTCTETVPHKTDQDNDEMTQKNNPYGFAVKPPGPEVKR